MKKLVFALFALAFVTTLSSCKKDFTCCQKENVVNAVEVCLPQKFTRKEAREFEDSLTVRDEEGMVTTKMTCVEQ